jgi:hypothetical protein
VQAMVTSHSSKAIEHHRTGSAPHASSNDIQLASCSITCSTTATPDVAEAERRYSQTLAALRQIKGAKLQTRGNERLKQPPCFFVSRAPPALCFLSQLRNWDVMATSDLNGKAGSSGRKTQ